MVKVSHKTIFTNLKNPDLQFWILSHVFSFFPLLCLSFLLLQYNYLLQYVIFCSFVDAEQ